jgi:predicted methyltransferase
MTVQANGGVTIYHARVSVFAMGLALLASFGNAADPLQDALGDPARTTDDRARDERDHTAQVLEFLGIEPGVVVMDVFAGGGYYSELIGRVVGPNGKVYLYNNASYAKYAEKPLKERVDRRPHAERDRRGEGSR